MRTLMNKITTVVLLGVIAVLLGYQSFAHRPFAVPTATVVRTFDLERTFNTIEQRSAEFDKIPPMAEQLQAETDIRRKELEQISADLELLVRGTKKHQDMEEKLALQSQRYRAYTEFCKMKIESEKGRTLKRLYLDIRKAAKQLAESRGYDLVLVDDSAAEIPPGNLEDLNRQISARRVVYTNVDMTDELIEFMNAEFKKAGGVTGTAAASANTQQP